MNMKKIVATAMSALFAVSAASVVATAAPIERNEKNIARLNWLDFSEESTSYWAAEEDGKWVNTIEYQAYEYPGGDVEPYTQIGTYLHEDDYEQNLEWSLIENREVLHIEQIAADSNPGMTFVIDEMHDDKFMPLGTENSTTPRAQYIKIRVRNYSTASRFTFGWATQSTNNGHFVSATITDFTTSSTDMLGNSYQSGSGEWQTYILDMPQLNKETNYSEQLKTDDKGELQSRWGASLYELLVFPFGYNVSDGTGAYLGASIDIDYIVIGDLEYVTNYKSALEIKEESITNLELVSVPTKTAYYLGESLDLEGLQLKATFSDGTSEILNSASYTANLSAASTSTPVTLTFGSKEVSYNISVTGITGIEVATTPEDTTYEVAKLEDGFTADGYTFKVNYADGTSSEPHTLGALRFSGDFTSAGTKTVTASYYGNPTTFDINLIQVADIEVIAPEKTYRYGNEIKVDDFTINQVYTDGSKIASGDAATELEYTVEGSVKVPGAVEVTIKGTNTTYGIELTKTATINVEAPTAMEVTKQPKTTTYDVGATFDPTGMTVSLVYEDGKKVKMLEEDYNIRADFSAPGEGRVTIMSKIDGLDLRTTLSVTVEGEALPTNTTASTPVNTTTAPASSDGAPIGLIIGIVAAVVVVAVIVVVVVLGKKKKK